MTIKTVKHFVIQDSHGYQVRIITGDVGGKTVIDISTSYDTQVVESVTLDSECEVAFSSSSVYYPYWELNVLNGQDLAKAVVAIWAADNY